MTVVRNSNLKTKKKTSLQLLHTRWKIKVSTKILTPIIPVDSKTLGGMMNYKIFVGQLQAYLQYPM